MTTEICGKCGERKGKHYGKMLSCDGRDPYILKFTPQNQSPQETPCTGLSNLADVPRDIFSTEDLKKEIEIKMTSSNTLKCVVSDERKTKPRVITL